MSRILFVTSRLPYPPTEGHQLRAWHLLRAAAAAHRVTLLSLRRPDEQPLPAHLPGLQLEAVHQVDLPDLKRLHHAARLALCRLVSSRTLLDLRYRPLALQRRFDQLVQEADLVHLDILAVAGLLDRVPADVPTVLNEHNVESLLAEKRIEIETQASRRWLHRLRNAGLKAFERQACERASRVLACSDDDARRIQTLAPGARLSVVPNGVDLETFKPGNPENERDGSLVFVGHMDWFPNRDGIEHFIAEILPLMNERPNLQLEVIGRNPLSTPPLVAANVNFAGFVDDLQARVQAAAVFIVPLRAGSGTRLKILEAMAMGKAIVSTRIGAEGIGLVDGDSALLADTPTGFAAAIDQLLDQPELRQRLGRRARLLAEQHYGWTVIGKRLLSAYDALLQPQADPGLNFRPTQRLGAWTSGTTAEAGTGQPAEQALPEQGRGRQEPC